MASETILSSAEKGSGANIPVRGDETHYLKESAPLDKDKEAVTNSKATSAPTSPSQGPPGRMDGGIVCWIQVIGSFAVWANTWGLVNAYGEFQTYYQQTLTDVSPSQISWIGSIQAFLLLVLGPISGPLYDAGYFQHMIVFGNFMVVFGLMMTSIAKEYWQIVLAQGVVCGIGFGMLFLPGAAIIPQYFVQKRAWANGIAACGSGVGGVIYPIILSRLVPRIGFGWTVRVLGFVSLFLGIVIIATMKNKLPPRKPRRPFDLTFFRDGPLTFYACCLLCICISAYVPVYYIGGYSLFYKITDSNLAFYLVPILQGSNIVGRLVPNFFADKIGPINMAIPSMTAASILTFAWIGIRNEAGLLVYAILYGLCFGIMQSIPPIGIVGLVSDMSTLGSKLGTTFFIASFGTLVGPPISGAILNSTGSYVGVQAFAGAILFAAASCLTMTRVTKVGFGITKL